MKQFEYTIKSELGIHARPAGIISKVAQESSSLCSLSKGNDTVNLGKVFALMALGVKCGDCITVSIDGEDEESVFHQLQKIFEETL